TGVASLNFTMYPEEISPGDVNYAPFWLGVNGSQDALITIPEVTGTNEDLDPELSYTIYTGATSCNESGVGETGVNTAYSGLIGDAPTVSNPVTAPQLSATPGSIQLCIAVSATSVQDDLPQGESTTITWQFTGTSVDGT
ncbi:MAG: hypothetical protein U1C73_21200, partial [Dietzia sp.]|nr:hypothetical protein [Dietzia sp.]